MNFSSITITEIPTMPGLYQVILNEDATIFKGNKQECEAFKNGITFSIERELKYVFPKKQL